MCVCYAWLHRNNTMPMPFETMTVTADRATSKAKELKGDTPPQHLKEVIGNLEEYLRLRHLVETDKTAFDKELNDDDKADLWFNLQDAYGKEWKNEEIEKIIADLKK